MASSLLPAGRKLVTATLPGLLHFGVEPIRLSPMFLTDKVRLYIPDREILNLEKVSIVGPGADRLARATCVLSSTHKSSAPPEALLDGKAIHTEREAYPYWELTFDAPQEVQEIEIGNRLGIWGGRSHGLCVDLFAPSNNVWRFDNANPDILHFRLGDFISRVRDLAQGLAGLPDKLRVTQAPKRTEVLRTAGALVDLAQQIICGGAAVADQARGVRAKVIAAVVAAGTGVSGPAAADIIRLSARVLDFLLERSDRPRAAAFTDAETSAVGIVFAARFIAKGRVELGLVRENEIFLGTTEATRAVEALVNDLYKSTGADPLVLPIMFRSHGMSGAELRLNAPKFVASMKEMETIFGDIGYECAICYGSLLGAVRTGEFIPHDDDVDMAIVLKGAPGENPREELARIAAQLTEKKISAKLLENHDFLKVRAPVGGKHVDIFPIVAKDATTVRMYMEQLRMRDVPKKLVLPFGQLTFYGTDFKKPANEEGFLADRYGSDWKIPKRQIGSNMLEI